MNSPRTPVVRVDPKDPDEAAISRAARIIMAGGLVIFPTETVYGIAADALNDSSIARLYEVKGRPCNKPFTLHVSNIGMVLNSGAEITAKAKKLIDRYWPGPLTIILRTKDGRTTGFRMPAHKVALKLIERCGVPVVAPSANLSGNQPPTDAHAALKELDGSVDLVLDAGKTEVGVESTVIDMTTDAPKILRQGAISRPEIETEIGSF